MKISPNQAYQVLSKFSEPRENTEGNDPILAAMRELGILRRVSGHGRGIVYSIDPEMAKEWSDVLSALSAQAIAAHEDEKNRILNLRKAQK
jgi:hypothetical protein